MERALKWLEIGATARERQISYSAQISHLGTVIINF